MSVNVEAYFQSGTSWERSVEDRPRPAKRAWSAPQLRRYELTEQELGQLRRAEDPMRELLAMKPELTRRKPG